MNVGGQTRAVGRVPIMALDLLQSGRRYEKPRCVFLVATHKPIHVAQKIRLPTGLAFCDAVGVTANRPRTTNRTTAQAWRRLVERIPDKLTQCRPSGYNELRKSTTDAKLSKLQVSSCDFHVSIASANVLAGAGGDDSTLALQISAYEVIAAWLARVA